MSNLFRSGYAKVVGLIAVIAIVIGIPLVILAVKSQQNLQQNAQIYNSGPHDTCNKLTFTFTEDPVCPRLNGHGINKVGSYTWRVQVSSNDGKTHTFNYTRYSDFCTHGYATGNPSQCSDNAINQTLNDSTPTTVTISRSPTLGAFCGTYQADFHISSVDNNSGCTYSHNNLGASGLCETGVDCHAITPTPKLTNTPTPTQRITNTPTPTSRLTPTNTPTPTMCVTPGAVTNVRVSCSTNCTSQ